jgi:hypothetical protein
MNGALFGQQGQPVPGMPGAYLAPQQLAPQGIFGSLLGGPVGGFLGGALGGVFGNPNLGRQIGQTAGTIGGGFLPFNVDPMAAYAQQAQQQLAQQQLAPQGFFGDLIGHVGQPLGGAIGGLFGNQGLGNQVGGAIGQLGKFLPFNVDPMTAYAQQAQQQLAPQGFFGNLLGQVGQPLGGAIGGLFGNQGIGSQVGGALGQLGKFLPFNVDPMAAYAQQAQQQLAQQQLAPQGFFGNLLGQVGQPWGGAIGGLFGNQGLGNQVGGAIGQLGKFLPFNVDPMAAYAQQAQQQLAQQQLAPQGFFGNLLGQVGQPLGGAIGGLFGNQGIGSQVGGAIGQLGKFLPFNADPIAAAYAQQQQLTPQGWLSGLLPPQFGQMISPTFPPPWQGLPWQGLLNRPLGSGIGSQ